MNKLYHTQENFGHKEPIDLSELDTEEFIPTMGGMLIIKIIHDYISPICCLDDRCFELADVIVLAVSKNGDSCDTIGQLCRKHLEEIKKLTNPFVRFN